MKRVLLICGLLLGLGRFALAQSVDTTPNAQTGRLPSGSYFATGTDSISNYNGNVLLDIPLISLPGREISQQVRLTYNSLKWQANILGGIQHGQYTGGWRFVDPAGTLSFDDKLMDCTFGAGVWSLKVVWSDSFGSKHSFFGERAGSCDQNDAPPADLYANDGSGILLISTATQRTLNFQDGAVIDFSPTMAGLPAVFRTANGNFLKAGIASNPQPDTLGRTVSYCSNQSAPCPGDEPSDGMTYFKRYTVIAANGEPQKYYLNYEFHHALTDPYYAGDGSAATALDDWLVSIKLPNEQRYEFEYVHAQGFLTKVTLPTGATIQYVYAGCPDSGTCNDVNPEHDFLEKRILSTGTGTPGVWSYDRNTNDPARTVTMTSPDMSSVQHTFNSSGRETQTRWLEVGGAELQRVDTTWLTLGGVEMPFRKEIVATVGSQHRQTMLYYDDWFHVRQQDDSDWYSESPSPLARTIRTFDPFTTVQPLKTVEVLGWNAAASSYETESRTEYFYDEGSLSPTPSEVPNKGVPYPTRANLTRIRHFKAANEFVDETFAYDDLGNLIAHHDPLGNTTTISYVDNFSNPGYNGSTYAYPTAVTNAKSQTAGLQYHFESGVVIASTDIRQQTTWNAYDLFNRPKKITEPSGRVTEYLYDDSARRVTEDVLVSEGKHRISEVFADGLFRPIEVVQLDPAGDVHQTTQYDTSGRVVQVSTPYRNGESPGYSTMAYDGLNRTRTVSNPDNTDVHYDYLGNTVSFTDEAGVQRRQVFNGLGQLVELHEPNPTLASPQVTTYSYKANGALARAVQAPQVRTFAYNWLGQLVSENHPETGNTQYAYDAAGNLTLRHDERGIDTTYSYDALSRLLNVVYSDGTPTTTHTYDASGFTGLLTSVSTGTVDGLQNSISYSYTAAGQVSSETRSFSEIAGAFTSSYSYDFDGRLTSSTYPSGRVVMQSYASSGVYAAGRIAAITDGVTGSSLLSAITTNAAGQITSRTLGSGTIVAQSYNARNQLSHIGATQGGATLLSMDYGYTGGGAANTGRIRYRTDNIQPEHTVSYGYDSMYRLSGADGLNAAWAVHWALDPFGNRTSQTATGMAASLGNLSIGIDPVTNRNTGMTYDAAGNVLNDGLRNYTYDGEGRMNTAMNGSVRYEYDGAGRRVKTIVGSGENSRTSVAIYGITGLQSEFTTAAGSTQASSTDRLTYRVPEQTGTGVLTISASGSVLDNNRVFPFGEPWRLPAVPNDSEQFTTYTHDDQTSLDYAMARDYAGRSGRFMTPDPGHVGASIGDPQSWNAYAYAGNDPVNHVDLLGTNYTVCVWGSPRGCFEQEDDEYESLYFSSVLGSDPVLMPQPLVFPKDGFVGNIYAGTASVGQVFYSLSDAQKLGMEMSKRADASIELIEVGAAVGIAGGVAVAAAPVVGAAIVDGAAKAIGWGYGLTGGSGVVLGSYSQYPNYINAAKALGANVYNLPSPVWSMLKEFGATWTANQAFLDASIWRGQQFFLSTAPIGASGTYAQELQYLISKGITAAEWLAVRHPIK